MYKMSNHFFFFFFAFPLALPAALAALGFYNTLHRAWLKHANIFVTCVYISVDWY